MSEDFSTIAKRYLETSKVQNSASEILLGLLDIKNDEDVLDIGAGTGNITHKIRQMTDGKVLGIDQSEGMVIEASEKYGEYIDFLHTDVYDLDFQNEFDVLFCNSTFQWFDRVELALQNCAFALKNGGRMGIQAPAKSDYCPQFVQAIEKVRQNPKTREIFSKWRNPWLFLEHAADYSKLFENAELRVVFSEIKQTESVQSPEETMKIFSSGAIAGYCNPRFYSGPVGDDYIESFKEIVLQEFQNMADERGMVKLVFNRIYLVAQKI